jgi:hypothetical protein
MDFPFLPAVDLNNLVHPVTDLCWADLFVRDN